MQRHWLPAPCRGCHAEPPPRVLGCFLLLLLRPIAPVMADTRPGRGLTRPRVIGITKAHQMVPSGSIAGLITCYCPFHANYMRLPLPLLLQSHPLLSRCYWRSTLMSALSI